MFPTLEALESIKHEYAAAYGYELGQPCIRNNSHNAGLRSCDHANWPTATDVDGPIISAQLEPSPNHRQLFGDEVPGHPSASPESGESLSDYFYRQYTLPLLQQQQQQQQRQQQQQQQQHPPVSLPPPRWSPADLYDIYLYDCLGVPHPFSSYAEAVAAVTAPPPDDTMPRRPSNRRNLWHKQNPQQQQQQSHQPQPNLAPPPPPPLLASSSGGSSSAANSHRHHSTGANLLSSSSAANGGMFAHLKVTEQQQQQNQRQQHRNCAHNHHQSGASPQASNPALMACLNSGGASGMDGSGGQSRKRAEPASSSSSSSRRRTGPQQPPQQPPQLSSFDPLADILTAATVADMADAIVQPEPLPFYHQLAVLLVPSSLRPNRPHHHFQYQASCDFTFALTRQQAEAVALRRVRDPTTGRTEYGVQVLLRCFKAEPGSQADAFPPGIGLAVNGAPVSSLPPPLPCRPGADPVRPGRPINISGLCRMSNAAVNRVRVNWTHRPTGSASHYCLAVTLARAVTPGDLVAHLLTGRVRPAGQTRRQIRQLLLGGGGGGGSNDDEDDDDEPLVSMTTLTVSLLCPLARSRIELPVRSDDCRHLQCFDARAYLAMNERRPTWRCPCCDRAAPYPSLYVDAHLQSVLADAPAGVDVVQFLDDGSWRPAADDEALAESAAATTVDDDEDEYAAPVRKRSRHSGSAATASVSTTTAAAAAAAAPIIVVDLTGDSDDDDAAAPLATTPSEESPSPPAPPLSRGGRSSGSGGASSSSNSSSAAAAAVPTCLLSSPLDIPTYLSEFPALPTRAGTAAAAAATASAAPPVFPFGLPPGLALCSNGAGSSGGSGGGRYAGSASRRDSAAL